MTPRIRDALRWGLMGLELEGAFNAAVAYDE
jgi:hypothetical protein